MKIRILSRLFLPILAAVLLVGLFAFGASAVTEDGRIVVVLDPGHGGNSTGTCKGGEPEYYYNMKVAVACKEALEATGRFVVYLTHTDNTVSMEHWERVAVADRVNADVCVSIHFNGNVITSLHGTETFTSVIDRFCVMGLAQRIQTNLVTHFGFRDIGVIRRADLGDETGIYYWDAERQWDIPNDRSVGPLSDYYGMITWGCKLGVPTIIVEHCYMSNPEDREIAIVEENLVMMGQLDAQAIIDFYTNHDHQWSEELVVDYPSNCLQNGKASHICSVCSARKDTVVLDPCDEGQGHIWLVESSKRATCTADGYTNYYCRIAQNYLIKGRTDIGPHTRTVVHPATGHNYVITSQSAAGHAVDGHVTYRCSNCGRTYTEVLKAEGHSPEPISETPPTCTEPGSRVTRCTVCGETFTETIPATGHAYVREIYRPATCTEGGFIRSVCSVCGHVREQEIQPSGHAELISDHLDARCDEDGYTVYTCTVCGESRTVILPMLGHDDSVLIDTFPTCTEEGLHILMCSRCGRQVTEIRPPLGHAYAVTGETPAGCETPGSRTRVCARCGREETETLPETGHKWKLLTETIPSLFWQAGKRVYVCAFDAAHTREETVPSWLDTGPHRAILYVTAAAVLLGVGLLLLLLLRDRRRTPEDPFPETGSPADPEAAEGLPATAAAAAAAGAPETEAPTEEAPETETPAEEAPETEAPAEEAPETEVPSEDAPGTETDAETDGPVIPKP